MSKQKLENKSTFEGKTFKHVPITVNRQDGLNPALGVFIAEDGNSLLVVKNETDVVLKIIGDGLTVIPLSN